MAKGEYNGVCNRKACDADRNVIFYNRMTYKYYCPRCARAINSFARQTLCEARNEPPNPTSNPTNVAPVFAG